MSDPNKAEREEAAKIDTSIIREMMTHWIPFPDAAYWKKFGIEPNADGPDKYVVFCVVSHWLLREYPRIEASM
jgi:hypothetical protein